MKALLMMVLLLGLGGCAGFQLTKVVTKTEVRVVTTPDSLLKACRATQPPLKNAYEEMPWADKENALATYSVSLLADLKACNTRLVDIKALQSKQVKQLESQTKAE